MSNQPYLSEIQLFACNNFVPAGWALCNGQLLSISQNQALFSLLGTTYGGNGTTTFALPDLRGRVPLGMSASHPLGEAGGTETVTLTASQIPTHTHTINTSGVTATGRFRNAAANQRTPVGNLPAIESANVVTTFSTQAADANMHVTAVDLTGGLSAASTGGSTAHENRPPTLTLNFCIAIAGIFPSRT